ncbi:MAG: extracellular solute-binding protein [Spirochaetia bacterium]|nr:extracellular solute-binding protein [Spirochaetia bacterium]
MKRTQVISIMLILLLSLSFSVFAQGAAEKPSAEEQQVTIRFLVPRWASTQDVRIERQVAFQSVIDTFEAQYPNVKVEEVVSSASSYDMDVVNQIVDGTVDVVWINSPLYPTLQEQGRFVNLKPLLKAGDDSDFFGWTFDALQSVNGELGGLWHNTDVRLFFYRSDLIKEPVKTFDELIAVSRNLKQSNPEISPVFFTLAHTDFMTHTWGNYIALGGTALDASGRPIVLEGKNRTYWEKIFTTYKAMYDERLLHESAIVAREAGAVPLLLSGSLASFIANSNYGVREITAKLPAEEASKWKASLLPGFADAQGKSVSGGWVLSARKNSNKAVETAAANFVLHATSTASQRNVNKAGGWTPTRTSVFSSDPFFENDPYMVVANEALKTSEVRPLVPIMPIITAELTKALGSYVSGRSTLDRALNDAQTIIQEEYKAL